MEIRLGKTVLCARLPFFAAAAFFLAGDMMKNYLLSVLFSSLHEAGHIVALCCFGHIPEKIILGVSGIRIDKKHIILSYKEECITALAGPSVNIFCAVMLILYGRTGISVFINFGLFFVNILPLKMLDGGRFLLNLLLTFADEETSEKIMNFTELLTLVCLIIILAVSAAEKSLNISYILFVIFLVVSVFADFLTSIKKISLLRD